jgi:pilus assembly protein CpaC
MPGNLGAKREIVMRVLRIIKAGAVASIVLGIMAAPALAELKGSGRTPENTMLVKIDAGGEGPKSERLVLPLHKGAIIELPSDARDVMVSNPDIVEAVVRSPRQVYIFSREIGQANVFILDGAGKQILNLELQIERDLDGLQSMIDKFLPSSRVAVEAISDNIVLSGFVSSPAAAEQARDLAARFIGDPERVLNLVAIDTNEQVMLKVSIVEMQRNVSKQFGTSWFGGPTSVGPGSPNGYIPNNGGTTTWGMDNLNPFSLIGQALSGTALGYQYSGASGSVSATLQMLERVGLVRTLAEPTLTAISGESANFLAGGEFPIPTGRDRDTGALTLEFKPFGVGLGFTPVVMSEGRISLRISTEVSELSSENSLNFGGGVTVPGLRVRRAETTVELPSGGSMVMAGLLQEGIRQNIDGIPGAKDMPVLGALFRSRDFAADETELVVIVTPYLVSSVNRADIRTPADGFKTADDLSTILLGRMNKMYSVNGNVVEKRNWQGPVGMIIQ